MANVILKGYGQAAAIVVKGYLGSSVFRSLPGRLTGALNPKAGRIDVTKTKVADKTS
jgi:hypothetical protein